MILFLDFDGVLHPFPMGQDDRHFSQIKYLWQILDKFSDIKVVITSTWREKYSFLELLDKLKSLGGEQYLPQFIGVTPILEDSNNYASGIRQLEIESWLEDNNLSQEHYLILDDIEEYFFNSCPQLYLVDGSTGLTSSDVVNLPLYFSFLLK